MRFLIAVVIAAAFGVPATAWCAKAPPNIPADRTERDAAVESTFGNLDTNRNGYMSRDEAQASGELNQRFVGLDKNGDGKLSMSEVTGWRSASYSRDPRRDSQTRWPG